MIRIKKVYEILRRVYIMVSNLYGTGIYYLQKNKNQKILKAYKDKYRGECCFVIGNGPSLSPKDLNELEKENIVTFAANKIYNIFENTDWRPTYISLDDEAYSRDKQFLKKLSACGQKMIFANSQYCNRDRKILGEVCFINSKSSRRFLKTPKFSDDLLKEIYSIATVTYFNLQLAYFMGFRTIYLLGVDNKYQVEKMDDGNIIYNNNISNYFDNGDKGQKKVQIGMPGEMNVAYRCAYENMGRLGFKIYNATRGGALEQFERVNFDEIIKKIKIQSER